MKQDERNVGGGGYGGQAAESASQKKKLCFIIISGLVASQISAIASRLAKVEH